MTEEEYRSKAVGLLREYVGAELAGQKVRWSKFNRQIAAWQRSYAFASLAAWMQDRQAQYAARSSAT